MSIKLYKSTYTPAPDPNSYDALPSDVKNDFPNYVDKKLGDYWKTGGEISGMATIEGPNDYSKFISPISSPTKEQLQKERYVKVFVKNTSGKILEKPVVYLRSGSTKSFISIAALSDIGWNASLLKYRYNELDFARTFYLFSEARTFDDDDFTSLWIFEDPRNWNWGYVKEFIDGEPYNDIAYHPGNSPDLKYLDDNGYFDDFEPVFTEVLEDYTLIDELTEDNYQYINFDAYLIRMEDNYHQDTDEDGVVDENEVYIGQSTNIILVTNQLETTVRSIFNGVVASHKNIFTPDDDTYHYNYNSPPASWGKVLDTNYFLKYYKWEVTDQSDKLDPYSSKKLRAMADGDDREILISSEPPVSPWKRFYVDYVGWKVPHKSICDEAYDAALADPDFVHKESLSRIGPPYNIRYERVIWLSKEGTETQLVSNNSRVYDFDGDHPVNLYLVGQRDFDGVADNVCYYTELDSDELVEYLGGNGSVDHIAQNTLGHHTKIVFLDRGPSINYYPLMVFAWEPIFIPEPYPYSS